MTNEELLDRVNESQYKSEWPVVHATTIKIKQIELNDELSKQSSFQQTWLTVSTVILSAVAVIQLIALFALKSAI